MGPFESSSITPRKAFFGSDPVRVRFVLDPDEIDLPTAVEITIVRRGNRGRASARLLRQGTVAGVVNEVSWRALLPDGRAARDGLYRVFARPITSAGAARVQLGSFRLRGHFFPVRGAHWDRGWLGLYGAPRSGKRRHRGFDVMARCGVRIAAVRAGRVLARGFDPDLYGHFVRIAGSHERRSYFYSHLAARPRLDRGDRVATGQTIGRVGNSGNAATTGCHLHLEIRVRGREVDPEPLLRRWDRGS